MAAVPVTYTWVRPLLPKMSLPAARSAQLKSSKIAGSPTGSAPLALPARVLGYSTPATRDVGGASLRLRLDRPVEGGGWLLGVRASSRACYLPAIAAVPDKSGLDRDGKSRVNLAELMVMARPTSEQRTSGALGAGAGEESVTFLHEGALRGLFREGDEVDVVQIAKLTDFFLGLNAGRWLAIRMGDIAKKAEEACTGISGDGEFGGLAEFVAGTGLSIERQVEEPPADQEVLRQHLGLGGNSGVSGQRIIRAAEEEAEQSKETLSKT